MVREENKVRVYRLRRVIGRGLVPLPRFHPTEKFRMEPDGLTGIKTDEWGATGLKKEKTLLATHPPSGMSFNQGVGVASELVWAGKFVYRATRMSNGKWSEVYTIKSFFPVN